MGLGNDIMNIKLVEGFCRSFTVSSPEAELKIMSSIYAIPLPGLEGDYFGHI